MKVLILYRPNSEHARTIEEFVHDFEREHGQKAIELISLDTLKGSTTAALYDITQYPALMVLANDGRLVRFWQGEELPLMSEVGYYAQFGTSIRPIGGERLSTAIVLV
jgi:hypothetical protein